MKVIFTILGVIIFCQIGISQNNPEDIILIYDAKNKTEKAIIESELSSDLDSLNLHLLVEKTRELLSPKDSASIRKLIIGNWKFKNRLRINGDSANFRGADEFFFLTNGTFSSVTQYDTIKGKWSIEKNEMSNLKLDYDEPQFAIKDKEILKFMSKEQIKTITYNSNLFSIHEIDDSEMTFSTFIRLEHQNNKDIYYRLILTTYTKNE